MADPILYTEHAVDVLARAVALGAAGRRFVLVTSTRIRGGAARDTGSLAVVAESGEMTGYMSNGCIDRDIQLQAQRLLDEGAPKTVLRYGEGSPFKDLVLPCGGSLELLLDPSPDLGDLARAHGDLAARRGTEINFALPDAETRRFAYTPKPLVALAGRGAVFRATARVVADAGFAMQLYSPEADDLAALAPVIDAPQVHLTTPDAAPKLTLDGFAAFLTLFHDHDWEPALLESALQTEAFFIGSLGSQRTHQMRLARLAASGVPEDRLARLRGPIGLVPSLRNAPYIAVSAVAELVGALPPAIRQIGA